MYICSKRSLGVCSCTCKPERVSPLACESSGAAWFSAEHGCAGRSCAGNAFCHLDLSEGSVCSSVLVCTNLKCYPWCPFSVSMKGGGWASRAASQLLCAPGNIQQRAGNGSGVPPVESSCVVLAFGACHTKTVLNE